MNEYTPAQSEGPAWQDREPAHDRTHGVSSECLGIQEPTDASIPIDQGWGATLVVLGSHTCGFVLVCWPPRSSMFAGTALWNLNIQTLWIKPCQQVAVNSIDASVQTLCTSVRSTARIHTLIFLSSMSNKLATGLLQVALLVLAVAAVVGADSKHPVHVEGTNYNSSRVYVPCKGDIFSGTRFYGSDRAPGATAWITR